MRNRWTRRLFVGLILAFPLLITLVSSTSSDQLNSTSEISQAVLPVAAVEAVLVGGITFAARERQRLRVELDAVRGTPRWIISRPASTLTKSKQTSAWQSVSGTPGV